MEFRYEINGVPKELMHLGEGLAVVAGVIALAVALVVLAFAAATYVLRSMGLYTMAKNRGIDNAWLAWVPVANNWLLGEIADDINRRKSKKTNYSLILLVLTAAGAAGGFSLILLPFSALFSAPVSIAASVVYFIALYEIYQDYAPQNAVVFLVLSILLSVQWLLLFILRGRLPQSLGGQVQQAEEQPPVQPQAPGWQPMEYAPQPQPDPTPVAEPACGWCPEAAPQQVPQPPKDCPEEHWGGILTVEAPTLTNESESDFPQK